MKIYKIEVDGSLHLTFEEADEKLKEIFGTNEKDECNANAEERKLYIEEDEIDI